MNKKLISEKWFLALLEDLEAAIITKGNESRFALIEGWHYVGKTISESLKEHPEVVKEDVVQTLALRLQRSRRSLFYAVKFYEKYPKLDKLPAGQNESWSKVIDKYLTDGKANPKYCENQINCPLCGSQRKCGARI